MTNVNITLTWLALLICFLMPANAIMTQHFTPLYRQLGKTPSVPRGKRKNPKIKGKGVYGET